MSTPPPSLLSLPAFSTASISRLQSLYSDFSRQKQSNPDSYHANITWWRNALQEFVWSGLQPRRGPSNAPNRLTLAAGKDVVDALRISGVGKPLGIGSVVAELTLSKALIYLDQFLSSKESVYNPGWLGVRIVKYVVGKPLWWALESLGIVGDDEPTKEEDRRWWGDYVLMPLVEHAADSVQEKQRIQTSPGPSGSLYTFDAFRREFIGALGPYSDFMSEVDAKVLIRYLERDRRVVVVEKEIIKFVDWSDNESRGITPIDRGILELKSAVEATHVQVDSIQHKMDEQAQKAAQALRANRKPIALGHLRLKKQLEDLLTKRLGSLHTLEGTLLRVEAAAGDIAIMKSYESSTTTLRMILSHPSLQRDKIDETMDALAEANEDARELDEVVRIGAIVASEEIAGDRDVELELDALVQEIEAEEKKRKELEEERLAEQLGRMQVPQEEPKEVQGIRQEAGLALT